MTAPRIALISAVTTAIPPIQTALLNTLPDAEIWNILDDRLLSDADRKGGVDDALRDRMNRLIEHAIREGADAVLLTCSLYGRVAHDYTADVPVLAPDDAVFTDIVQHRFREVMVVGSLESAMKDSMSRLTAHLNAEGSSTSVLGTHVPPAIAASRSTDPQELVRVLADGCATTAPTADAVLLAQYSLAPAAEDLASALGLPVFSGPASAAHMLQTMLARYERRNP